MHLVLSNRCGNREKDFQNCDLFCIYGHAYEPLRKIKISLILEMRHINWLISFQEEVENVKLLLHDYGRSKNAVCHMSDSGNIECKRKSL